MRSREQQDLQDNVQRLSRTLGAEHLAVADAWVSLGLTQLETGDPAESENSFRAALKIRQLLLDESDETITHIHYYIGRSYYERADHDAARSCYESCVDVYENECRPEDSFLATVLDALASLHHDRDQFKTAESLLKRALFIRLCVLDPFDAAIAESLNHLGWLYSQHGKFKRAEELFICALDIWMSAFGLDHANTAMCLENYAFVLRSTDRANEANKVLEKVKSIRSLKEFS